MRPRKRSLCALPCVLLVLVGCDAAPYRCDATVTAVDVNGVSHEASATGFVSLAWRWECSLRSNDGFGPTFSVDGSR